MLEYVFHTIQTKFGHIHNIFNIIVREKKKCGVWCLQMIVTIRSIIGLQVAIYLLLFYCCSNNWGSAIVARRDK